MNNNELIEQIKNPQTPLRNKIPLILDLAEQRNREIYPLILAALNSAEYAKVRGTLIYALANYPAKPLFEKAIGWLIDGNFEMAHEAVGILNKIAKIEGSRADKAYAASLPHWTILPTKHGALSYWERCWGCLNN